jgi:hypothetical protein
VQLHLGVGVIFILSLEGSLKATHFILLPMDQHLDLMVPFTDHFVFSKTTPLCSAFLSLLLVLSIAVSMDIKTDAEFLHDKAVTLREKVKDHI